MLCAKKKVFRIIVGAILTLLIVVLALGYVMFGTFINAARSIEELEPHLYSLEYVGDYGLDEFLAQGGAESDSALADFLVGYLSKGFYHIDTDVETGEFGCSTISTQDENGLHLFGRNHDWEECDAMILLTKPKNGYESISTCCLDFLGFGEDYRPDASMANRMMAIAAVYVPLDGMNEKGFMVADLMAGDQEATNQDNDKVDLTTTTAIRLLLDRAANVDEAIELLSQYDMHSSIGAAHHLSMSDATGKNVVVEYVDGKMYVQETKVVTNHYLADTKKKGTGSEQSHLRYDKLMEQEGPADGQGVRNLLKSVAQFNYPQSDGSYEKTMWSIVYYPEGLCADFYFSENFDHSYGLLLLEKGEFLKR